jgi:hypothetical protein
VKAAQIALAALAAVLLAGGVVLFVADEDAAAWTMTGFGLFGYLSLLGMIATDRRPQPPGLR